MTGSETRSWLHCELTLTEPLPGAERRPYRSPPHQQQEGLPLHRVPKRTLSPREVSPSLPDLNPLEGQRTPPALLTLQNRWRPPSPSPRGAAGERVACHSEGRTVSNRDALGKLVSVRPQKEPELSLSGPRDRGEGSPAGTSVSALGHRPCAGRGDGHPAVRPGFPHCGAGKTPSLCWDLAFPVAHRQAPCRLTRPSRPALRREGELWSDL